MAGTHQGPLSPVRLTPPRMDKLFYIINFSCAKGGKETVNIPALRDKIKKEI